MSQSSRPVSGVVAPVVANTPHLVLMLAVVLPPNSSPESGAGAAASTAWSCRPHNLSLLSMSYLDTMSPQTYQQYQLSLAGSLAFTTINHLKGVALPELHKQ